jgi:hypothetical protein
MSRSTQLVRTVMHQAAVALHVADVLVAFITKPFNICTA